ncbi:hypothetical protein RA265_28045, partial [Pseudomonas syringae pv. tagetis]|uniref:hypothetical protein n=1 Tax=Pseudomonas syringae group genomosp. 7 TaxID=251699 RepID=UPI00376F8CB7
FLVWGVGGGVCVGGVVFVWVVGWGVVVVLCVVWFCFCGLGLVWCVVFCFVFVLCCWFVCGFFGCWLVGWGWWCCFWWGGGCVGWGGWLFSGCLGVASCCGCAAEFAGCRCFWG